MDTRLVVAILIVVGLPALLIGYILLIEAVLRLLPGRWQNRLRPWLWIAPALSFLGFFLVYPTINTVLLSLQDKFSKTFVGLANYQYFFSNPDTLVVAPQQRHLDRAADGPRGRAWACSSRCSSTGCATSRRPSRSSSCRWRSASSGPGIIWRFVYDYAPRG